MIQGHEAKPCSKELQENFLQYLRNFLENNDICIKESTGNVMNGFGESSEKNL